MKILYLHGIGSGANSRTPMELRKDFPDAEIVAPELPVRPLAAMELLREKYWNDESFDLIVGTSLGGFYALTFPFGKRVLVNPAMFADTDIRDGLGLGVKPIFCQRSDGATEYTIDEGFIDELRQIRKLIYQNSDIMRPDKMNVNLINSTYALFGEKDELLHHYEDFCRLFCEGHALRFPGEHRLSPEEVHMVLAPFIRKVLKEPEPAQCFFFDDFD